MLYSCQDAAWKVADFGLTVEGTSKRAQTTIYGRGTPSYRAPELVHPDGKNSFTNKVDIWAIGCIQYELVFSQKAFPGDFYVYQYFLEHQIFDRRFRVPEDMAGVLIGQESKAFLSHAISAMLEIDASRRPTAKELCEIFIILLNSANSLVVSTPVTNASDIGYEDGNWHLYPLHLLSRSLTI